LHPERDQAWFENECRNMSKRAVAQELLCNFASSGDTFLSADDIEWIGKIICPPKDRYGDDRNVWIWKVPLSAHHYVISADIARGDSVDYSAFHVIDLDEGEVVAEYKGKIQPDRFAELLADIGKMYYNALLIPENNSFGYATILKLKDLKYPKVYRQADDRFAPIVQYQPVDDSDIAGFNTNGKTRIQILTKLEEVIRNKQIKIYSSRFYEELKTFVWTGARAQAMKDHNDDLVMSLAIGLWVFDVSSAHGHDAVKLNEMMLAGMGTTSTKMGQFDGRVEGPNKGFTHVNPYLPYFTSDGTAPLAGGRGKISEDLAWLFKK
jgi:hypothetical protein